MFVRNLKINADKQDKNLFFEKDVVKKKKCFLGIKKVFQEIEKYIFNILIHHFQNTKGRNSDINFDEKYFQEKVYKLKKYKMLLIGSDILELSLKKVFIKNDLAGIYYYKIGRYSYGFKW